MLENTVVNKKMTRRVRRTAESLCEWLHDEKITVGTKLPPLNSLSKQFGVSVNTLHSAVKHLSREGILEAEVGSGTFLLRLPNETVEKTPRSFCQTIGMVVWDSYIEGVENFTPEQRRNAGWGYNIIDGIHEGGKKLNLEVKTIEISREHRDSERKDEIISALKAHADQVDGFIFFPMWYEQKIVDFLVDIKKPWVIINPQDHFLTTNHVTPDYYGSSILVGELAARLGAQRIWIVTFTPSWPSCRDKIKGLRDGLVFSNASSSDLRVVVYNRAEGNDAGRTAMLKQLATGEEWPDFIYTSGDDVVRGIVELAKEHGREPGKDLSIVSSTGLPDLADFDPPISTVQLPMRETGETAVRMINRMAQLGLYTIPPKIIPTGLVLRQTTPPQANDILEEIKYGHQIDRQMEPIEM